jgi:4-hydroxybenzoate polyprenyltransferase
LLPWQFGAIFAVYYLTTMAYSLRIKQIAVVDVFVLASLYTIRILAGGYATALAVSEWLLLFSMFFFLSLAFGKRFSELRIVGEDTPVNGRGYIGSDFEFVHSSGLATGAISVLVLALYINHTDISDLYGNPTVLWAACPLLMYWICRVWFLARRGEMNDDPILFALRDRQSWVILAIFAAIGFAASPQ